MLGGSAGVYHADYLISVDQEIPDRFIILLLGEDEAAIRLHRKSWFAVWGLALVTPF